MRLSLTLLSLAPALLAACNLILQNEEARRAPGALDASVPPPGPGPSGSDGGVEADAEGPLEASTPDAAPFDASAAPFRRVLLYGTGTGTNDAGTNEAAVWMGDEAALDAGWQRLGFDPGFEATGPVTTDDERVYTFTGKGLLTSPLTDGVPGPAQFAGAPQGSGPPCAVRAELGALHLGCAGGPNLVAPFTVGDAGVAFGEIFMNAAPTESRAGMVIQPTPNGFFGYGSTGKGFEWRAATGPYQERERGGLPTNGEACSALVNGIVYVIFATPSSSTEPSANAEYYSDPAVADWGFLRPTFSPQSVGAPLTCAASNRALYVSGPRTGGIVSTQVFATSSVLPDGTLSQWVELAAPPDLVTGAAVGLVTTRKPVAQ